MQRIDMLRITDHLSEIKTRKSKVKMHYEMWRNNEDILKSNYELFANLISKFPNVLRPMESMDVIAGNLYILVVGVSHISMDVGKDNEYFVGTIDEVLHPDDQWKAFCSDDGCRYGLDGCFVIKEEFR